MTRARVALATLLAICWLPSCNTGEIVHEYTFDPAPLESLKTPLVVDLWHLPAARVLAKDGMNTSAKAPQPDGVADWVRLDVPPRAPHRSVTTDIRIFDTVAAADRHIAGELDFARPSRPEKYRRGVLPNGVAYVASYIVQHRADPEGCNAPMESYGSFLIFRHGKHVVSVRVREDRPRGITASDLAQVAGLLTRTGGSAP